MGVIFFNGISSASIPLVVEQAPNYKSAAKDYNAVHVLGRNGDVLIDNDSYQNVEQPYNIAFGSIEKDHSEMAAAVSEWLRSASGYARLEDSYDPDIYRMAYYGEETDLENILNHLGKTTITFTCMPQKWLKSGERPVTFTAAGKLYNPTRCKALPLLTISGTGEGTLRVNDIPLTITDIGGTIVIDCDIGEAYFGATPKNDKVKWEESQPHVFPSFMPGQNDISFTGGITSVEVIPKWWRT